MARLTNDHRRIIVRKVLRHGFLAHAKALSAAWAELADAAYTELFAKELPIIKNVPEKWLKKRYHLAVTIDNKSVWLFFGSTFSTEIQSGAVNAYDGDGKNVMRVVPCIYDSCGIIEHDHALSKDFRALCDRSESLDSDHRDARLKVTALLDSVSSDTALLKVWPEVAPFLVGVLGETKVQLPSAPVAHLNAILDLPIGA